VLVYVDAQPNPMATITTSGWYKFQMTYRKGANPTDLVPTDMKVFDSSQKLVGITSVVSNSIQTLLSHDLGGPDGWADDIVAIDDVRADLSKNDCKDNGWQAFPTAPGPFKNQGDCVSYFTKASNQ
jgi:hypothetical protein